MSVTTLVLIGMIEVFIIAMCHFHTRSADIEAQKSAEVIQAVITAVGEMDIDEIKYILNNLTDEE